MKYPAMCDSKTAWSNADNFYYYTGMFHIWNVANS